MASHVIGNEGTIRTLVVKALENGLSVLELEDSEGKYSIACDRE